MLISAQQAEFTAERAAAGAAPAVSADGLGCTIDGRRVLSGISLEIPVGAAVSLLGANGAGKSTLLRLLSTLVAPTDGRLRLFGFDGSRATAALRARIGLVGHQSMLYRDLSLLENLEFFGKLYGVPAPRERAMHLITRLGLAGREHDPVRALSRGMTQRVAVARALVHSPPLLLADEPFSGLDASSAAALEELFEALRSGGTTIIMASHDVAQSLRLSRRIIALRAGRVVLDAPSCSLDAEEVLETTGGGG
ncbi:MAG: ABC transporter ATP-binding protein [Phycisphaerales bacterium]|nr:ABC transporter ATP-binding protein [Phycisphaerales bacterium]